MSQNLRVRFCSMIAFVTLCAGAADGVAARDARYVITDHGAVGDGTTVNTRAIQAVIDRCAAEGGGVIVVPPGTFLSGALFFRPGVDLLVEKDAVLKSTTVLGDFPPVYTRWEGIERYWTAAFLNFVGLKDVTVSGAGTIDGSGDAWAVSAGVFPVAPKRNPERNPRPPAAPLPHLCRRWSQQRPRQPALSARPLARLIRHHRRRMLRRRPCP